MEAHLIIIAVYVQFSIAHSTCCLISKDLTLLRFAAHVIRAAIEYKAAIDA